MIIRKLAWIVIVSLIAAITMTQAHSQEFYQTEWIRQLGTASSDIGIDVSADGLGKVYICGVTYGSLDGSNAGGLDGFVSKYDSTGAILWTRQFGTPLLDTFTCITADELGNVFVCGKVTMPPIPPSSTSLTEAFVRKYTQSGNIVWTSQFGWDGTTWGKSATAVSADNQGNVYVCGDLYNGTRFFIRKYNSIGTLLWERQPGTAEAEGLSGLSNISADGIGNVYVSGSRTRQPDQRMEAILIKYNSSGVWQWTRQFGTEYGVQSTGVSADSLGNIFITGYLQGSLDGPNFGLENGQDMFIRKYDSSGTLVWGHQVGTGANDISYGVSVDGLGNVFMCGITLGSPDGPYAGSIEPFISKYGSSGVLLWMHQFGTEESDGAYDVSADGNDNVYVVGHTNGLLGDIAAGNDDVFTAKFLLIPEPVAYAGPDQVIGAGLIKMDNIGEPPPGIPDWQVTAEGAEVLLDASSSDPSPGSSIISYQWHWMIGSDVYNLNCIGPTTEVLLPAGVHTITLTVEDALGPTNTDEVVITVLDAIPGDINNDGYVNLGDFIILRQHFGESR